MSRSSERVDNYRAEGGKPTLPLQLKIMFVVATAKAIMVVLALHDFLRKPKRRSAVILGVIVLFAYPFGLFIDPTLNDTAHPSRLISLSALFSYATVAAIRTVQVLPERTDASENGTSTLA